MRFNPENKKKTRISKKKNHSENINKIVASQKKFIKNNENANIYCKETHLRLNPSKIKYDKQRKCQNGEHSH